MAAMVFPSSPTVGQTYVSGNNTWIWTGTTWDAIVNVPNLTGGSIGTIPYQSATNTTAMLAAGSAGQILSGNGAAAPSWLPTGPAGYLLTSAGASAPTWSPAPSTGFDGFLLMGA